MRGTKLLLVIMAIATIFIGSCTCRRERIPLDGIDLEVKVKRFDKDLFSINIDSISEEVERLELEYGDFFHHFTEGIIGIGLPSQEGFEDYLISFISDNMVSNTYAEVQRLFPDTYHLDETLTNAFKRYSYYFPEAEIPNIYGFISGFNNSIMLAEGIMGIGFDRYLGQNFEYYPMLGIPQYIQENMHPQKIPSDLIRSWAFGEFQYNDSIDNLLNNMVYEGKLMYLTKKMLPDQPDSLIFGFTSDQIRWCGRNESQMWAHLVEHKLLFNTDRLTINKFVSGAPFTHAFTRESPGRASVWLGYRIVSRFMDRNKDYTLQMLMKEDDYQGILNRSRYNP